MGRLAGSAHHSSLWGAVTDVASEMSQPPRKIAESRVFMAGRKVVTMKCRLLSDATTRSSMRLRQQCDIGRGNARP